MKRLTTIIWLLFILSTCADEEITSREYPRVKTKEVVNVTSTGALFQAEVVLSTVEIIDHGFVWSPFSLPTVGASDKISLGNKTGTGPFEATIDRSLAVGKEHYVRAYARSANYLTYGDEVKFTSLGSLAPVVDDFAPKEGIWGDTVIIKGKNFSEVALNDAVKFGDVSAHVVKISITELKAIVPVNLVTAKTKITVIVSGQTVQTTTDFTLRPVVVEELIPLSGTPEVEIKLKVKNFRKSTGAVKMGDKSLTLKAKSTDTELYFDIPPGTTSGSNQILVSFGGATIVSPLSFTLLTPIITSIEPNIATFEDVIVIKGSNFGQFGLGQKVFFGTVEVDVQEYSSNQIKVTVPYQLDVASSTIKISFKGYESFSPDDFSLSPPEITSVNPVKLKFISDSEETVVITGQNFNPATGFNRIFLGDQLIESVYSITGTGNELTVPLSIISIPNNHEETLKIEVSGQESVFATKIQSAWARKKDFPGMNAQAGVAVGTDIYVYDFVQSDGTGRLFEFETATNNWGDFNETPGADLYREMPIMFGLNGNLFFGGGVQYGSEPLPDFHQYEVSSGTWTQLNDLPFLGSIVGYFSISNVGYVVVRTTDKIEVWRYNPISDNWTKMTDYPGGSDEYLIASFALGNDLYFYSYLTGFWKFNVLSSLWSDANSGFPIFSIFSFYSSAVGGLGYIATPYELYSFDSNNNTWNLIGNVSPYLFENLSLVISSGSLSYYIDQTKMISFDPSKL